MFEFGMIHWFILFVAVVFTAVGYFMGRGDGVNIGAAQMIGILEDNGFLKVKSRRVDPETGAETVEYSKVDE